MQNNKKYWILQHNDGRISNIYNKPEARFWAWISYEFILCNVYVLNGDGRTLLPCEIIGD